MEARKNFVINAAFYGIIAALAIAGYRYIVPILTPFIVGFCVASVVQIPMRRMKFQKNVHRRLVSSALCVAFYAIIISLLILVGVKIVNEIGNFAASLPELFQSGLYPFFIHVAQQLKEILAPIDPSLAEMIIEMGKNAASTITQFVTDLSAGAVKLVASGAVSLPNLIVQIVIAVVSTFYIAADYRMVLEFLKKLIPESKRSIVIQALRYAEKAVLVYIKSYSLMFFITFFELWVGLSIMGISYSFAIALGIAVFDLMPVLGTGGILLPWAAIALVMGDFPRAIGVALLYVVITAVRNAIEPRIVGDQIGLHPLATLVAMILGLKLMGLIGMILFPISLVAIMNLKKSTQTQQANEVQHG